MLSAGVAATGPGVAVAVDLLDLGLVEAWGLDEDLSLIHISEPTRLA